MRYRKLAIIGLSLGFSATSFAGLENYCGEIKRMRTWLNGTDEYGVWVEFSVNPASCSGGFYLPQLGNNRDKVYSFLLASKIAKSEVCIQATTTSKISNRCGIHYVMDK